MNPDVHSPPPPDGDEGFENLLRALPVRELPEAWRMPILAAAGALPGMAALTAAAKTRPFFSKPLTVFLISAWSAIAVLHFTAPDLPPPSGPSSPPVFQPFPGMPEGMEQPWLAQNPSAFSGAFPAF